MKLGNFTGLYANMYLDKFGIIHIAGHVISDTLDPPRQIFLARLYENGTTIYNTTLAPLGENMSIGSRSIYVDKCGFTYIVGSKKRYKYWRNRRIYP